MDTITDLANEFDKLIEKYREKGVGLKVSYTRDVIYVFSDTATPLMRAKNGIGDVTEFSYTVSEHHPFWSILDNSVEIIDIILERWNENLDAVDLDDINWHMKNLQDSLQRLTESSQR